MKSNNTQRLYSLGAPRAVSLHALVQLCPLAVVFSFVLSLPHTKESWDTYTTIEREWRLLASPVLDLHAIPTQWDFPSRQCLLHFARNGEHELVRWVYKTWRTNDDGKSIIPGGFWRDAFVLACAGGHLPVVRYLWEDTATTVKTQFRDKEDDVNYADAAITDACSNGHTAVAKYLWDVLRTPDGESLIDFTDYYNNALQKACRHGHLSVAKCLLEELKRSDGSAAVNVLKDQDAAALYEACAGGHLFLAKYLWERMVECIPEGSAFNVSEEFYVACACGKLPIVRWLWTSAQNSGGTFVINVHTRRGRRECHALEYSIGNGFLPVVQFLWDTIRSPEGVPLLDVTAVGELAYARALENNAFTVLEYLWNLRHPNGTFAIPRDNEALRSICERAMKFQC